MTMTREELKGKQTPGDWFVRMRCKYGGYATYSVESAAGQFGTVIADRHIHDEGKDEYMAGLFLAAEAGTVANRTGMWPEDLVARVKELEEALRPFTHPDLCETLGGNVQGDESPLWARNKAMLKLGHFKAASATLNKPTP